MSPGLPLPLERAANSPQLRLAGGSGAQRRLDGPLSLPAPVFPRVVGSTDQLREPVMMTRLGHTASGPVQAVVNVISALGDIADEVIQTLRLAVTAGLPLAPLRLRVQQAPDGAEVH